MLPSEDGSRIQTISSGDERTGIALDPIWIMGTIGLFRGDDSSALFSHLHVIKQFAHTSGHFAAAQQDPLWFALDCGRVIIESLLAYGAALVIHQSSLTVVLVVMHGYSTPVLVRLSLRWLEVVKSVFSVTSMAAA